MSGYKWKAGDWAIYGLHLHKGHKVTPSEAAAGDFWDGVTTIALASCTPGIVHPKPLPRKIKRSELRAWFYRQAGWQEAPRRVGYEKYGVTTHAGDWHYADTLEAAILALRKALRKAGRFTP